MYCKEAPKLLDYLVARGKRPKMHACSGLLLSRRLSRSEGDLCEPSNKDQCAPDSPMCFRSQTGSDDSGVRVSLTSDDSGYQLKSKVMRQSFLYTFTIFFKTILFNYRML